MSGVGLQAFQKFLEIARFSLLMGYLVSMSELLGSHHLEDTIHAWLSAVP